VVVERWLRVPLDWWRCLKQRDAEREAVERCKWSTSIVGRGGSQLFCARDD